MRPVTYANSRAQELFCMSNQHGSGGAALIADEYFGQTVIPRKQFYIKLFFFNTVILVQQGEG
jgi:hypothetical protein